MQIRIVFSFGEYQGGNLQVELTLWLVSFTLNSVNNVAENRVKNFVAPPPTFLNSFVFFETFAAVLRKNFIVLIEDRVVVVFIVET